MQPIRPGAINLMTAGRGIVHSDYTAERLLESGQHLHGIQTWIALPEGRDKTDPAVEHVPADELAAYVVDGAVRIGACELEPHTMGVVGEGRTPTPTASASSRVMLIGGRSPGQRHVWWKFVASSRDRIEQAKADRQSGRFAGVPGDHEFTAPPEA